MSRARRPLPLAAVLVTLAGLVALLVHVLTLNEAPAAAPIEHSAPAGHLTRSFLQHP